MNNLKLLTEKINKVCPIEGVNEQGQIWYGQGATEEQKALALDIYNNWESECNPDIDGFVSAISQDTVINQWYESLPRLVSDQLAIYLNAERFAEIETLLTRLTIPDEVKTQINLYINSYNIPVSL